MSVNSVFRDVTRYAELLEVGQIITSEMNFDHLLSLLVQHTNAIMKTEASTIFLFDKKKDELWSLVTTNLGSTEIRIPSTKGIAGWVFQHRTHCVVNEASNDPRFNSATDTKTGFHTRNLLCAPLITRQDECIGVLQALNKLQGVFDEEDVAALHSLSNYATVALENSRLYEDLKAMNKARERAISHLSHELKTPLSLVAGLLTAIKIRLEEDNTSAAQNMIEIASRNIQRLLRLQVEINHIIKERGIDYRNTVGQMLEDCMDLVRYQKETNPGTSDDILHKLLDRLDSIYRVQDELPEEVSIVALLGDVCDDSRNAMHDRNVEIAVNFGPDISLTLNRTAFRTVFEGILRNAIENTPDEGRIEVQTRLDTGQLFVEFRDFGTGITAENQKLIFTGFFHTQDTNLYSTKTPYAFNAGGSGADLLRAKAFSERYGFTIDFLSRRCSFIPEDTDQCPGRISKCPFVSDHSGCETSGTMFTVRVPVDRKKG